MQTSKQGYEFIKANEGLSLIAYPDGKGINEGLSIGYGHYLQPGEAAQYTNGNGAIAISKEEAERLLIKDITERERALNEALRVEVSQPMFDALVDFGFSMSGASLAKSDLVRAINSERSKNDIGKVWLNSYVKYGGDKNYLPLVKRREREFSLAYSKGNEIISSLGFDYAEPHEIAILGLLTLLVFGFTVYFILK